MKVLLLSLFSLLSLTAFAQEQNADSLYMRQNYEKLEFNIPMRDGVKLFTIAYVPKEKSKTYPFLLNRTCYNASGYGNYNTHGHPSNYLVQDKYILVFQDVRGRYMSEGVFDNMTPNIPGNDKKNKKAIDESSDTYDTIEWLLKNVKGNNGKAGIYGISYPGFYSAAALPDAHQALKAVSPQAPVSDFFFDDFHHMGAYLESYTPAFAVFGYQKPGLTKDNWFEKEIMRFYADPAKDAYDFYLRLGPLKNITEKYHYDNFFWKQIIDHPNYDDFWQKRSILPHLKNITPAVMTVGGWFDAEDLYGPLNIYKAIEKSTPKAKNTIVMGPWSHGGWARESGRLAHNHIYFGDSISTFYQREIERKFFDHYLKDGANPNLPEAYMFDTGIKQWKTFDVWPPKAAANTKLYFGEKGRLGINKPQNDKAVFEYTSDPAKPVPYTSQTEGLVFTPRNFMSDDQRNASRRPDVLTFESEILTEDMVLSGEILARLDVSMTGTDADFIVKLVDVYPDDEPNYDGNPENIVMGSYQQLVRSEAFRGRFRNSFEKPEPFVPNKVTRVNVPLQDILHTFKKGHRIMIQVHSTWFPYIDRNPQKYVDNIYKANEEDFIKSTIRVYGSSVIEIGERE
ncbi:CocE/NonD family hydrolase [Flavobacterium sp. MFBS3-15]|uniref:CocE/NonD family hydrolase n=1 Tax=Flavobacterium sp. MFBS3-15 TaxID=2989816 RepID=UPI00223682AC|nr:CocE/NonD family hydrolase [Flavobacterium sp. MFBS3-15]MCW4467781.1 CocE/NonD family hydrolase [Flavobacterium sp. MFBS3-15]